MLAVETDIAMGDWPASVSWAAIGQKAVAAAFAQTPFAALVPAPSPVEVAVRLTTDEEVLGLNRDYRGKDKPTNVLSFAQYDAVGVEQLVDDPDPEILLGDIVLALETCGREAQERGISIADHAAHLIVHGTLHLLGYDHLDDASGDAMEALETKALATLGLADPYAGGSQLPE